jgi:hypothetical protein
MFDPFAEKAFDAHSAALLRVRPKPLLNTPAPQTRQRHTLLGARDNAPNCTPVEISGLRALRETPRNK